MITTDLSREGKKWGVKIAIRMTSSLKSPEKFLKIKAFLRLSPKHEPEKQPFPKVYEILYKLDKPNQGRSRCVPLSLWHTGKALNTEQAIFLKYKIFPQLDTRLC
jgi:hypothetical protein